ncbi:uncharacterized protein ARMOST_02958 [Armillaria ostoyae]|uniref:Uncharacterized protein n=1 Tax=Armillaria ostoyae TaxID=47428 RepID=A0A284QT50_ARMOS|nr:uncharacterized protein ARMOST_02958 [Armillaria ostoyae]
MSLAVALNVDHSLWEESTSSNYKFHEIYREVEMAGGAALSLAWIHAEHGDDDPDTLLRASNGRVRLITEVEDRYGVILIVSHAIDNENDPAHDGHELSETWDRKDRRIQSPVAPSSSLAWDSTRIDPLRTHLYVVSPSPAESSLTPFSQIATYQHHQHTARWDSTCKTLLTYLWIKDGTALAECEPQAAGTNLLSRCGDGIVCGGGCVRASWTGMHAEGVVDGKEGLSINSMQGRGTGGSALARREGRFSRHQLDEGMVAEVNFATRMRVSSSTEVVCGGRMRHRRVGDEGVLADEDTETVWQRRRDSGGRGVEGTGWWARSRWSRLRVELMVDS